MGRPCGSAGGCGCTVRGVDGIRTSGPGTVRDPILIGLNNPLGPNGCDAVMDCVGNRLTNGLRYNDTQGTIGTGLSGDAGNSIVYGSDGGLYSSGDGGSGGGGVTVDSLPASNIVGAHYGAGYYVWPEGLQASYQAATTLDGVPLVHVPVRRTDDLFCVAAHYRQLSNYDNQWPVAQTDTLDAMQYQMLSYYPSGRGQECWNSGTSGGYFGFRWPADTTNGGTTLADVFGIIQRHQVLLLENKDLGISVEETARFDHTANVMVLAVQKWGLQKSVIISGDWNLDADADDHQYFLTGMDTVVNAGIAAGVHINTPDQAAGITPGDISGIGATWVIISYTVAEESPTEVTKFRDAGLNVLLHSAHRQYHYELQRTMNLRGLISGDPVYCGGWKTQFRYHGDVDKWGWAVPDYGRFAYPSPTGNLIEDVHSQYRGCSGENNNQLVIPWDAVVPGTDPNNQGSAYFLTAGRVNPLPDPDRDPNAPGDYGTPDNYLISINISFDMSIQARRRWGGVAFAVPNDRPLYHHRMVTSYCTYYHVELGQNGLIGFFRTDGIVGSDPGWQFAEEWQSTWEGGGALQPDTEYRLRIRVEPTQITVGQAGTGDTILNGHTFTADHGGADMYRGPYMYIARHVWNVNDSTNWRFSDLEVTPL